MKTRFLIIIAALVLVPMISDSFAEQIKVKFGETVSYEDLKFYFYDIEDSRCPSDVTCIWEGQVWAMIRISNETRDIGGYRDIGNVEKSFPPFVVTLKDVQPYPVSTEKPDYVATLEIEKQEPKPSDFHDLDPELAPSFSQDFVWYKFLTPLAVPSIVITSLFVGTFAVLKFKKISSRPYLSLELAGLLLFFGVPNLVSSLGFLPVIILQPEQIRPYIFEQIFVALWVPAVTLSVAGILLYSSSVLRKLIGK